MFDFSCWRKFGRGFALGARRWMELREDLPRTLASNLLASGELFLKSSVRGAGAGLSTSWDFPGGKILFVGDWFVSPEIFPCAENFWSLRRVAFQIAKPRL